MITLLLANLKFLVFCIKLIYTGRKFSSKLLKFLFDVINCLTLPCLANFVDFADRTLRFLFILSRGLLSQVNFIFKELDLLTQSNDLLLKSSVGLDKNLILFDRNLKLFLFTVHLCLQFSIGLFQQVVLQPHFRNLILDVMDFVNNFSLLFFKECQFTLQFFNFSLFLFDSVEQLCSIFMRLIEAESNLTESPNGVGQFLFRLNFVELRLLFGCFQLLLNLSRLLSLLQYLFLKAFFLSLSGFKIFGV